MTFTKSPLSLKQSLLLDAVATGGTALLLAFGASFVGKLTQLPPTLLQVAGFALFPFVAFVTWQALKQAPHRGGVWAIIIVNFS